jgi:3',5'-cyclic AMP phosphodiesterase CpdA
MGEHPGHAIGKTVVIAHLSDPHLTTPVVDAPWRLGAKRWLGYLSWLRKRRHRHQQAVLEAVVADIRAARPDHWLVSGDLTHLGFAEECAEAEAWLRTLAPPAQVTVIPGNHDCLVQDDWIATVGRWQDFLCGAPGGVAATFPGIRRLGDVAIIGVNSAVPTRLLFADGRVGGDQRDALERLLVELGEQGVFRLVLMHHSPLASGHPWRKRLRDAAAFEALLDRAGAELVVHGHGHQEAVSARDTGAGALPIIGAPSASMRGDAGWNLLEITPTKRGWQVALTARRHREPGAIAEHCVTWQLVRTHATHGGELSSSD